jgi:hypothetical protein
MQMSSTQLFVFVEGKQLDPFFYASVCQTVSDAASRYEICRAVDLSGTGGGKAVLLTFFVYLRSKGQLISLFKGKRTAAIFFVDKDLDDVRRTRKRSAHVVYTTYYDVENHIFEHGDLIRGAASAASVDPALLLPVLSDARVWCQRSARRWREWLVLCLCVSEMQVSCQATYRVPSRVQMRPCGPTNQSAHTRLVSDAASKAGVSTREFQKRLDIVARRVDRILSNSDHHRIFKGKWFASILADEIHQTMGGRPYDSSALPGRLTRVIAATLDFDQPWAAHFREPVANVAAQL